MNNCKKCGSDNVVSTKPVLTKCHCIDCSDNWEIDSVLSGDFYENKSKYVEDLFKLMSGRQRVALLNEISKAKILFPAVIDNEFISNHRAYTIIRPMFRAGLLKRHKSGKHAYYSTTQLGDEVLKMCNNLNDLLEQDHDGLE